MNFTLKILGTASALPTSSRYPSAQVLDVRGRLFLLDCGEGVQMQMRRMKISPLKIEVICISHIHGDHVFGFFGLVSTMGMLGRTADLKIFAPKSFAPILKFFLSYYGEGLNFKITHTPIVEDSPEIIFETRTLELLTFPLNHRIETFGFILREKTPMLNIHKHSVVKHNLTLAEIGKLKRGEDLIRNEGTPDEELIPNKEVAYLPFKPRSYAYCSDTAPFANLPLWIEGVDLLYHEATFPAEFEDVAKKTHHSTTIQAAKCAKKAGVKKLIVGHYSSRFRDVAFYLDEINTIFPNAELAKEGMVVEIELEKFE